MKHIYILLFLFVSFISFSKEIVLKGNVPIESTEFHVLEDFSKALSINEVVKLPDSLFQNIHYTKSNKAVYWAKINFKNGEKKHFNWLIEFVDPHINELDLYKRVGKGEFVKSKKVGYDVSFQEKKIQHKNYVFEISFDENEKAEYWVRFEGVNVFVFIYKIKPLEQFINYSLNEYYYLGVFYGVIFILMAYNAFLYFTVKEKSYLYFCVYVLACALFAFMENGLGFQYVWPGFPFLNYFLPMVTPSLLMISFFKYTDSLLSLKTREKKLYDYTRWSVILFMVVEIAKYTFELDIIYDWLLNAFPYLLVFTATVKIYKKGYKPARFFVIGYSALVISLVVFALRVYGYVGSSIFTVYMFNFAFLIESLMFSWATGDKYSLTITAHQKAQEEVIYALRNNEELKDKVNKELEGKVSERTKELQQKSTELQLANVSLEELKHQLYEMNQKLDKDNWKLQRSVKQSTKAKINKELATYDEFVKVYPDELSCYNVLNSIKTEKGFTCKKCGSTVYSSGAKKFQRICVKCKFPESITANTLFHGIKFPIQKAFYIAYIGFQEKSKMTLDEMSDVLELRKNTCWAFRKKTKERKEILTQEGKVSTSSSWENIIVV